MAIRAGVLFFTIYEINYNSNEGKERRKGVYVLTMHKLMLFYTLRITINDTATNSTNSAPKNFIYLPFLLLFLPFMIYSQLFFCVKAKVMFLK